ncbi:MAG TPA: membrane dipeptidase [Clostridia bacterium]
MILKPKICDLHNDLITVQDFENAKKYLTDNSKFLSSIVLAVWTTHTKYNTIVDIKNLINEYQELNLNGKLLFGIEDISFLAENDFEKFLEIKPFYVSLTWNYDNYLGGGAFGERGLTQEGKQLLRVLKQNNIVLDTAHLNERTFWDCIDNFDGYIINSHTAFYSIKKHKRNINDEQIKAIIDKKGVIGLSFVGEFLCNQNIPKEDDVIRHIDHYLSKFEDKGLCFGTDYFGTQNLPKNLKNYSDISLLVEKLNKIGYNKKVIDRLFYKNFESFLRFVNGT